MSVERSRRTDDNAQTLDVRYPMHGTLQAFPTGSTIRTAPTALMFRYAEWATGERGTMNEVIRFALLGLGVGALYAFASRG